MSQQELLRLLQQKDQVAFAKLETQFGPLLRYCIRAILPDPREQEECLADLFVQIWNRIDSYDPAKGEFPAWIATLPATQHSIGPALCSESRETWKSFLTLCQTPLPHRKSCCCAKSVQSG